MKKDLSKIAVIGAGTTLSAATVAAELSALDKPVELIDPNSESFKEYGKAVLDTTKHMFENKPYVLKNFREYLPTPNVEQYQRTEPKIQRNEPCPCGSGKKYKNCCIK